MIIIFNNIEYQRIISEKYKAFPIEDRSSDILGSISNKVKKHKNEMIIIDSELKAGENTKYTDLYGLKLAYQIRTNPALKFCGYIKLFGFLDIETVLKNPYAGILKSKGVSYFRYPGEVEFGEMPPISTGDWNNINESLDFNFKTEFNDYEHGFKSVIIFQEGNKEKKKEELLNHLKTLKQINETVVINNRVRNKFTAILTEFDELMKIFDNMKTQAIIENFNKLKSNTTKLNQRINATK